MPANTPAHQAMKESLRERREMKEKDLKEEMVVKNPHKIEELGKMEEMVVKRRARGEKYERTQKYMILDQE